MPRSERPARSPEELRENIRNLYPAVSELLYSAAAGREHYEDLEDLTRRFFKAAPSEQLIMKELMYETKEGYVNACRDTRDISRVIRAMREDPDSLKSERITKGAVPVVTSTFSFVGDTDVTPPPEVVKERKWNYGEDKFVDEFIQPPQEEQRIQLAVTGTKMFVRGEAQTSLGGILSRVVNYNQAILPIKIEEEMRDHYEEDQQEELTYAIEAYKQTASVLTEQIQSRSIDSLTFSFQTIYYDPFEEREVPTHSGNPYGVMKPSSHLAVRSNEYSTGAILIETGKTHSKRRADAFERYEGGVTIPNDEQYIKFAKLLGMSQEIYRYAELLKADQQSKFE